MKDYPPPIKNNVKKLAEMKNYDIIPLTFDRARIIRHDGDGYVFEGW